MSPIDATDIDKIKQLIATATTAKQKQMYQNLLVEAEEKLKEQQKELAEQQENTPTESAENVGQIKDDGQDKKDDSNTNVKRKKRFLRKKKKQEVISEKKLPEKEEDNEVTDNSSQESLDNKDKKDNSSQESLDNKDLINNSSEEEDSNKYTTAFQAVGVVQGKVTIKEEEKLSLELGGKNYELFPGIGRFWAKKGLQKQMAQTGKDDYPLMVYPKITHFPQKHQPHNVYFQLVAFDAGNHPEKEQTTFTELNEGEFKIFGLWQFIPPSRLPCISVFRNYSPKLLEYIKQGELAKKVQITKATHVPIIWKDSPVQPFRFNPKLKKEEQKPLYFVSIKAKFLPEKNLFLFIEQLAEPTQDVPRFLKTRKEDKMELNKQRNKTRKKSSFKKGIQKNKKYPKPSKKPAPISKSKG